MWHPSGDMHACMHAARPLIPAPAMHACRYLRWLQEGATPAEAYSERAAVHCGAKCYLQAREDAQAAVAALLAQQRQQRQRGAATGSGGRRRRRAAKGASSRPEGPPWLWHTSGWVRRAWRSGATRTVTAARLPKPSCRRQRCLATAGAAA